jgi:enediyne biosynthesis protein E11
MPQLPQVLADLVAESEPLDQLLSRLDEPQWQLPTPAPGWTIAHQVAHLTADFHLAGMAATDPAGFEAMSAQVGGDFDTKLAAALQPYLTGSPADLLARWRSERDQAVAALAALPADQPVPWLSRPLTATQLAAAGVMELFAHGYDIADTLGHTLPATDRLRHVVAFALGNWDFGYQVRGLPAPATPFRYELTAPSGAHWSYGPADASQRVTGTALDFCLLVTRRRHRSDLAVETTGDDATRWLEVAQGYRGAPGPGRKPGQFRTAAERPSW